MAPPSRVLCNRHDGGGVLLPRRAGDDAVKAAEEVDIVLADGYGWRKGHWRGRNRLLAGQPLLGMGLAIVLAVALGLLLDIAANHLRRSRRLS